MPIGARPLGQTTSITALLTRAQPCDAGYGGRLSEPWTAMPALKYLQPNIDGLSFDEVLLIGLVPGIVSVLMTRWIHHRAEQASDRSAARRRRPTSGAA